MAICSNSVNKKEDSKSLYDTLQLEFHSKEESALKAAEKPIPTVSFEAIDTSQDKAIARFCSENIETSKIDDFGKSKSDVRIFERMSSSNSSVFAKLHFPKAMTKAIFICDVSGEIHEGSAVANRVHPQAD